LSTKVTFAKIVYDDRNADMRAMVSNTKRCLLHFADQTDRGMARGFLPQSADCED